ncbi:DUF7674 family protein [Xanthomonas vesicatoria]|uniref:DUF7674 domain-containing protein n=1 Tax=Xanthomonas vesicatoria ATCC 35937 TaxID=925775 RepID=F0BB44_9XANT|nr:hypothetical protein [Xanthomonas vesicatoria]APP74485.1 hypothetical protein BJD12_03550 [Xanthomonas vesicatoria ATCC 35937]EGD10293.1 hypothetical protein XVE_1313 [Xanthomonas vesicatoria ATCC 35937]KTF32532.1 hypothetical protein LMG920_12745 [Xanthomonas vesicatoria]KTF38245.1 hypothetical protein LMG919_03735 [Xanthomonas vesicatoria]MCC8556764.1 hypothetical protein [Xanthomonas vesicatoria]
MIEQSQVMLHIVEACPSFRSAWEAHLLEYGNDVLYVAAGELADHLLVLHRAGDSSTFPALAAAIEQLHVNGSPWVQEFATVGILEAVQNVWGNAGADPETFAIHLGPESLRWWKGLNNFWPGRAPIVVASG